ncbi:S9 family peptidase [Sanyastnella coralliicola]|uniref:S9 family peptidase n=1 Tax=Sanyastnella coralliicola TaxID=3069118 RepID=UPI0027B93923|nr:S9 family peptidase [Longitalea sp. SCSIO 12813]
MKHLFAISFIMLLALPYSALAQKQELSNELIWYSGEFRPEYVGGLRSMSDGVHYTSLEYSQENGSEIVKYSFETGKKVATLATSKDIFNDASTGIDDYEFSADEKMMLISTDTESIYRHSTRANYYVYNIEKKRAFPLADAKLGKQRLATFSPAADKVAFIRENNIFITDIQYRTEVQVTADGKENVISNGATDWVYEEEFGFDKGMYWSPNGDRLAYYKFNEDRVKQFQMAMYGELYPDQYTFKYPKAGEKNSLVNILVYDLEEEMSKPVDIGTEQDIYIPRIKWTLNNNRLCVMRMNRHQNHLEFLMTNISPDDPFTIPTKVVFEEKADTYIEINDNLIFLEDGKTFLWNSERDGYNHIYRFDMSGNVVKQLTKGEWDVIEFLGLDQDKGQVFYSSSEVSAIEQHVYSVSIKRGKKKQLSTRKGSNSAVFSEGCKYYINYHTDANTPYYISLHDSKGKELRVLKDNSSLKKTLKKYDLSQKEFFTFDNRNGDALNCWMIKPADFDPAKKYPVYVAIYGGPGHNTVSDSWGGSNYLYHQLLAQNGYIVVSVDPRGTMYRGREFKHSTYMQLGKYETEDFIDFAKYMGNQDYVDAERIGIQGWSYGGYMTSLCMTKGAEVYTMGIAVAPVTNWRYYDTIYTERFMRTPQENASGYDDNSPINHVDKLEGKYFLIHGSADDNVHYQNTMEMIDAMVKANKQFDLFIYPNKNHGIYGGNTRLHLFTMMLDYTLENL